LGIRPGNLERLASLDAVECAVGEHDLGIGEAGKDGEDHGRNDNLHLGSC